MLREFEPRMFGFGRVRPLEKLSRQTLKTASPTSGLFYSFLLALAVKLVTLSHIVLESLQLIGNDFVEFGRVSLWLADLHCVKTDSGFQLVAVTNCPINKTRKVEPLRTSQVKIYNYDGFGLMRLARLCYRRSFTLGLPDTLGFKMSSYCKMRFERPTKASRTHKPTQESSSTFSI